MLLLHYYNNAPRESGGEKQNVSAFQGVDLVTNGENEEVSIANLDDYLTLTLEFALESGIRKQMEAFRSGFNQVTISQNFFSSSLLAKRPCKLVCLFLAGLCSLALYLRVKV